MNRPEMWRIWAAQMAPEPIVGPCEIVLGYGLRDVVIMHADQMELTGQNPVWYCRTHRLGFDYGMRLGLASRLDDRCPVSRLEEWRAHQWEQAS